MGGSVDLHRSARGGVALSTLYHARKYDDPGPLPESLLGTAPRVSLPYFRFDRSAERLHRLSLSGSTILGSASRASGYLTGEAVNANLTRTLQLSPDFADTRGRATAARRLLGSMQLEADWSRAPWPQRLLVGTDASRGRLHSEYRPLLMGGPTEYSAPPTGAGDVEVSGHGTRDAATLFAHWEHRIAPPLRFVVGGLLDWLRDDYGPELPAALPGMTVSHRAFSPKLGMNFQYLGTARQTGHLYVSMGRSFKAPTLQRSGSREFRAVSPSSGA